MLCNEDFLKALEWANSVGGLKGLMRISKNNLTANERFVSAHDWIHFLVEDKQIRSNTSVCLTLDLPAEQVKALVKLLEREEAAFDIASYRDAPLGLRIWCGSTFTTEDVEIMLQWLEWAYREIKACYNKS